MAEAKKETEEYSVYLRSQMGDTLSDGVAEVLARRPRDPIKYLAEYLYKSKKMTPPKSVQDAHERRTKMQKWTPGFVLPDPVTMSRCESKGQSSDSKTVRTNATSSKPAKTSQTSRNMDGYSIQSTEIDGDFQEHEFIGPEVYVHETVRSLLNVIGDLFDDDKIS